MDVDVIGFTDGGSEGTLISEEELGNMGDVKKGPWTDEEDALLIDYVRVHGEGRWNFVANFSGLKRTGKSCRLRWLNYLKPDVRRGNITLEEQLVILDLHSRLGNRWSKIAKYLPGRTDNEIKNYWRTRVQKQAKQLQCDVNSKEFRDAMHNVWIPQMMERIQASSGPSTGQQHSYYQNPTFIHDDNLGSHSIDPTIMSEMSVVTSDSSDAQFSPISDLSDRHNPLSNVQSHSQPDNLIRGYFDPTHVMDPDHMDRMYGESSNGWLLGGGTDQTMLSDDFWTEDNIGFLQRQLSDEDQM